MSVWLAADTEIPAEAGVSLTGRNPIFFRTWRVLPSTRVIVSLNGDTVGEDTGAPQFPPS